jgi:hypothetical protein
MLFPKSTLLGFCLEGWYFSLGFGHRCSSLFGSSDFLFAAGTLSGKVDVSVLARFQAGSTMSGQLSCPSVVVEQGAFLDCDIASLPAGVSGFQHLLLRLRAHRLIKRMAKLELARPRVPDDVHLNAAA